MTMPAIIKPDYFEVALVHSDSGLGGKSRQMVDLNGSYRTKNYDMKGMGSNAQINDLGLMTMIANTQSLVLSGEAIEIENLVDNDLSQHQRVDIELLRAFGVEIATMGDFVREVMAGLSPESPLNDEQKAQLFELVTEIITLKKLTSLGALPQGADRLQEMIAQTAEKIADILKDGLDNRNLSQAVVEFTHQLLTVTAQKYDLPQVSEKLVAIEGRMNPQQYLAKSVAELVTQLTALLEQQDIAEDVKENIQNILDELAEHPADEPLPRDIIKSIDTLTEKLPENHAVKLQTVIEKVKDANIVMKAEISGLTIAQVKQVEAVITELETVKEALTNGKEDLTVEQAELVQNLETTIKALDKNPADITAVQETVKIQEKLSLAVIAMAVPSAVTGMVSKVLSALAPVQQIQEVTLAKRHNVTVEAIRDIAAKPNAPEIIRAMPVVDAPSFTSQIATGIKNIATILPFVSSFVKPEVGQDDIAKPQPDIKPTDIVAPQTAPLKPEAGKDDGVAPIIPVVAPESPKPTDVVAPDIKMPPVDAPPVEAPAETPVTPSPTTPDTEVKGHTEVEVETPVPPVTGDEGKGVPEDIKLDPEHDAPDHVDDQPDVKTPEKQVVDQPDVTPPEQPQDAPKSCGDHCQCGDDFNQSAAAVLSVEQVAEVNAKLKAELGDKFEIRADGQLVVIDDAGKPQIVENSPEIIRMAGGDPVEAAKLFVKNQEIEQGVVDATKNEQGLTNTESKTGDDAIRAAIIARQKQKQEDENENKGKNKGDVSVKHAFGCACCAGDDKKGTGHDHGRGDGHNHAKPAVIEKRQSDPDKKPTRGGFKGPVKARKP